MRGSGGRRLVPENRIPAHPGEILLEEFLKPMKVTQVRFAAHIGVPLQRVNEIIRGRRGVTAETACLFAGAFGTSPEFWLNAQALHDLAKCRTARRVKRLQPTA